MRDVPHIVIVGGGQAGRRAAEGARAADADCRITIIGEEPHLPYDRPPLSKDALHDAGRLPETEKRGASWYAENRIDLQLGRRVVDVDPTMRTAKLEGGAAVGFDRLILATGSRPRRIDLGIDPSRVHVLRTRGDAVRLTAQLASGRNLAIVGAGFIGLETAATARRLGAAVEVFEAAPFAMARVLPEFIARTVERRHRQEGTILHLGVAASPSALQSFDAVVVGIGVVPNVEIAMAAGVACDDGIVVDAYGRTSVEGIYAAGEVTRHPSWRGDGSVRLESWQVAEHQAFAAGSTAAGEPLAFTEIPWFWSDQHDMNIQVLGHLPRSADWVLRGDPDAGMFSAFALQDGVLQGVVAVNSGRDIAAARRLLARGFVPPPAMLADATIGWNAILKAA